MSHPALPDTGPPGPVQSVVATVAPAVSQAVAEVDQHAEETLRGRIREAVQAAVRCPAAARMMGRSGKAGVAFDYRDGALAGEVQVARSSGTPMLDAAALAAVRDAHYPKPMPQEASHMLRFLIWVEEACGG
jgi:protein TonB